MICLVVFTVSCSKSLSGGSCEMWM